jgi:hypothetical protein
LPSPEVPTPPKGIDVAQNCSSTSLVHALPDGTDDST